MAGKKYKTALATINRDKFYGIEAVFKDNVGNWFSLTQAR